MINEILENIKKEECNISLMVKDLKSKKTLIKYNEQMVFPSASVIKVIILMTIMKKVNEGILNLNKSININEEDFVEYSTITEERKTNYTIRELLIWMIVTSDNSATNVLIDLVGMDSVNNLCKEIGLNDTSLSRKMMDFKAIEKGYNNFTSNRDMMKVMELLYREEFISKDISKYIIDILKGQRDKKMLMRYICDDIEIANKGGELDNLNHDMGIIYLKNIDYYIGVFVSECIDNDYGQKTVARISKYIYEWINSEYER